MYSWRVLDGPTRSRCGLSGEKKSLESCGATFAGSCAPFRGRGPLAQGYYSAMFVVGPARSLGLTLISSAGSRVRLLSSATSMARPVSRPK